MKALTPKTEPMTPGLLLEQRQGIGRQRRWSRDAVDPLSKVAAAVLGTAVGCADIRGRPGRAHDQGLRKRGFRYRALRMAWKRFSVKCSTD